MLNQIVAALKVSLAECKRFEDPATYVYELSEVLKRYKTNIYTMLLDQAGPDQDPKEFFHIKIVANWKTRPGHRRSAEVFHESPTLLLINGYRPVKGVKQNKEDAYNTVAVIDDVVDLKRIAAVKVDYYKYSQGGIINQDEGELLVAGVGAEAVSSSIMFSREHTVDEIILFTTQINSQVQDTVVSAYQRSIAGRMSNDSYLSLKTILENEKADSEFGNVLTTPTGKRKYKSRVRTPSGEKEVEKMAKALIPLRADRTGPKSFFS